MIQYDKVEEGVLEEFEFLVEYVIWLGLNIFYSSQDMIKDRVELKAMFSPLHMLSNNTWYQ